MHIIPIGTQFFFKSGGKYLTRHRLFIIVLLYS